MRDVLVNLHGEAHKRDGEWRVSCFGEPISGDWNWKYCQLLWQVLLPKGQRMNTQN